MSEIDESAVCRLAGRQCYYLRRSRGSYKLVNNRNVVTMEGLGLAELDRLLRV
jgi:hypothetical protein